MLIEQYEGKTCIVVDIETVFNRREMQEYKDGGRDVEIWTTIKTKPCGCTRQWISIYSESLEKITRHSIKETTCKHCGG